VNHTAEQQHLKSRCQGTGHPPSTNKIKPILKTRLNPTRSAIAANGSNVAATVNPNPLTTQTVVAAEVFKLKAMLGKATLTIEPSSTQIPMPTNSVTIAQ